MTTIFICKSCREVYGCSLDYCDGETPKPCKDCNLGKKRKNKSGCYFIEHLNQFSKNTKEICFQCQPK